MKRNVPFWLMLIVLVIFPCIIVQLDHRVSAPTSKIIYEETESNNEIEENVEEMVAEEDISNEKKSSPYLFEGGKIHAVAMEDATIYATQEKAETLSEIKKGTFLNVLSEQDDCYEVECGETHGFVDNSCVKYFVFHRDKRYTLGSDVSHYNYGTNFKNSGEFAEYLLKYDFNYVIIRIGGKGYGKAGKMFSDERTDFFASVCEYLGVPYTYYFLDEAITEQDVFEEVRFVMNYVNSHPGKFQVLPISIDMEFQHGKGRADLVWAERVPLLNQLIDELKKENLDCMLYANGARIETYLKEVNCPYWTAMYPVDHKIPVVFYDEFIRQEEEKNRLNPENVEQSILSTEVNLGGTETIHYSEEYLKKVVGWQFTEDAASLDGIEGMLDLSLMDNEFFEPYYMKAFEQQEM